MKPLCTARSFYQPSLEASSLPPAWFVGRSQQHKTQKFPSELSLAKIPRRTLRRRTATRSSLLPFEILSQVILSDAPAQFRIPSSSTSEEVRQLAERHEPISNGLCNAMTAPALRDGNLDASADFGTLPQLADAAPEAVAPPKFELPAGQVPILDAAKVLTPARAQKLTADIIELEQSTGFRLRILTRYAPGMFDADQVRDYWKPDDRTAIVIVDITSPNIFNFNNTGDKVRQKLPRQFFIELQSRFGNQFYVSQEGDQSALLSASSVLLSCLSSSDGCQRVPGLSEDLFGLTLATSIAGGAVFGFAARQEPTGQVTATWQWVLLFSPLWFILFVALGLQPIASRTSEVEPLLKDSAAFLGSAFAVYLTPILGESPVAKWLPRKDDSET